MKVIKVTFFKNLIRVNILLLMVYYKIVALDENELRNYLQTLVKNIKKVPCVTGIILQQLFTDL